MSIRLSKAITDQYASYLRTHFYFADRGLGGSFESALKNTLISNGPFIEAVPDFERGACPSAVVAEGSSIQSDAGLLRVLDALTPHLYAHQEAAVRRVLADRNVVVATGTGSGKTEAFLYPILAHLYGEHQGNKLGPGVRALILYPMNALANDQRERLGGLCRRIEAADPAFRPTFGQYIGETPENERDNQRDAQTILREQLPGELVFRQQMRESPPHILLTN